LLRRSPGLLSSGFFFSHSFHVLVFPPRTFGLFCLVAGLPVFSAPLGKLSSLFDRFGGFFAPTPGVLPATRPHLSPRFYPCPADRRKYSLRPRTLLTTPPLLGTGSCFPAAPLRPQCLNSRTPPLIQLFSEHYASPPDETFSS